MARFSWVQHLAFRIMIAMDVSGRFDGQVWSAYFAGCARFIHETNEKPGYSDCPYISTTPFVAPLSVVILSAPPLTVGPQTVAAETMDIPSLIGL